MDEPITPTPPATPASADSLVASRSLLAEVEALTPPGEVLFWEALTDAEADKQTRLKLGAASVASLRDNGRVLVIDFGPHRGIYRYRADYLGVLVDPEISLLELAAQAEHLAVALAELRRMMLAAGLPWETP